MKKTVAALIASFACAAAFAGANNLRIVFSTPGTDTYADGTEVLKGERYALVWKASADDVFSIAADGSTTGGKIVLVHETAEAGCCSPVMFQVDDAWLAANGYDTGVWAVYLLDTRVVSGDGAVSFASLDAKGVPASVNASGEAQGAVGVSRGEGTLPASAGAAAGSVAAATQTALPADVPKPVVKAIEIKGDFVHVTVANTIPALQYTLAAGEKPGELAKDAAATAPNGTSSGVVTIVTPKSGKGGFFKVIRK